VGDWKRGEKRGWSVGRAKGRDGRAKGRGMKGGGKACCKNRRANRESNGDFCMDNRV
jgi:hypothetical protein